MTTLKVVIAGSRGITDYKILVDALRCAVDSNVIVPSNSFEIISGGAKGVDTLARKYAADMGYHFIEMKPLYNGSNDRGAPLRRNMDMANYGDVLVAVWDGKSTGTRHIISYMRSLGKPVYVYNA